MLDIFAQYATDPQAELEGKDFPWGGGVSFKIARANNPAYNRMITARFEQFKHELEQNDTDADRDAAKARSDAIMAEVTAKTILLGWSGPLAWKGQLVGDYSVGKAQEMLATEEFRKAIMAKATDYRNYRFDVEEADAKNSETTSAGS